jgi:hypothetical protein
MKLNRPYVGRDLMRPEPSLPRTSTPPPLPDENELTLEELGEGSIELGTLIHKMDESGLNIP